MGRAPCCEKVGLKKGPWSNVEDQILINFIQINGHSNWRALPKQAGLLRCGKSCRLRWTNYLRPDIKRGDFTNEEEETIIKLHQQMGNRWAAIAAKLPGRTDNEIKNVWHTHLKKRLNQNQTSSSKDHQVELKKNNIHFRDKSPCSVIKSNDDHEDVIDPCIKNNDHDDDDTSLVELAFGEDFLDNLLTDEEFFENDWNLEKDLEMIKGDYIVESPKEIEMLPFMSNGGEMSSSSSSSDTVDIMDFWRSVFMRDGELPDLQEINLI